MSNIKNEQSAKGGLSSLFGGTPSNQIQTESQTKAPEVEVKELNREELIETLSDESKELLKQEIKRRQYLKSGRPPKGKEKESEDSIPMTFRISPEKQEKLRNIALQRGLFIREILDKAIDLVIEDFEKESR